MSGGGGVYVCDCDQNKQVCGIFWSFKTLYILQIGGIADEMPGSVWLKGRSVAIVQGCAIVNAKWQPLAPTHW